MISRIIFTIIISSLFFSAIGQTKKNCEVLDALLKYDEARKVFFFDKHKDLPITFIDVNIIFNDCAFNDYYGRKGKLFMILLISKRKIIQALWSAVLRKPGMSVKCQFIIK